MSPEACKKREVLHPNVRFTTHLVVPGHFWRAGQTASAVTDRTSGASYLCFEGGGRTAPGGLERNSVPMLRG